MHMRAFLPFTEKKWCRTHLEDCQLSTILLSNALVNSNYSMQILNTNCLQFVWFMFGSNTCKRMNHHKITQAQNIYLTTTGETENTKAADDRSEHVFRLTRNLQAIRICLINIRATS